MKSNRIVFCRYIDGALLYYVIARTEIKLEILPIYDRNIIQMN
jgi:hypothetical protein